MPRDGSRHLLNETKDKSNHNPETSMKNLRKQAGLLDARQCCQMDPTQRIEKIQSTASATSDCDDELRVCLLDMQMFTPEERGSAEDFLAAIRKRTNPFRDSSEANPVELHPSPSVKSLRAVLTEAKAFLGEVCFTKVQGALHEVAN